MSASDLFVVGEERGKLASLRYRVAVIEILRFLKHFYSYKELSNIAGVNDTTLCRYIKGAMLPSMGQAKSIWDNISSKISILKYVFKRTGVGLSKPDIPSILSEPVVLRVLASKLYLELTGKRITYIVTKNSPILSLATSLSLIMDKPLILVSEGAPLTTDYIVEKVVEYPDGIRVFFIPKRPTRKREDVVVVWDIAKSPNEVKTLVLGLSKAKMDVRLFVSFVSMFPTSKLEDVVEYKYFIRISGDKIIIGDDRTTG